MRTRPAADPIKFTVDKTKLKTTNHLQNKSNDINTKTNGSANIMSIGQSLENAKSNGHTNGKHLDNEIEKTNGDEGSNKENVDKEMLSNADLIEQLKLACSLQNKEACLMCSS